MKEALEYLEWASGADHSISSSALFNTLTGLPAPREAPRGYAPQDLEDFGRTLRLVRRFPRFFNQLQRMMTVSPRWRHVITHWELLEEAFETNDAARAAPVFDTAGGPTRG